MNLDDIKFRFCVPGHGVAYATLKEVREKEVITTTDGIGKVSFNDPMLEAHIYTGRKDKNETDIYEGDVFNLSKDNGSDNFYFVQYRADRFWLSQKCELSVAQDDGFYRISLVAHSRDREVIGNTFENPELLEAI